MASESFEIMKIFIPLGEHKDVVQPGHPITPINDAKTEAEWQKAVEFAREGWDLVAVIPLARSYYSYSYTAGYVLFFKRRIQ